MLCVVIKRKKKRNKQSGKCAECIFKNIKIDLRVFRERVQNCGLPDCEAGKQKRIEFDETVYMTTRRTTYAGDNVRGFAEVSTYLI